MAGFEWNTGGGDLSWLELPEAKAILLQQRAGVPIFTSFHAH